MQYEQHNSLPKPDSESARHSNQVARFIRDEVASAGGCISFAEYMHQVLYAPGLGYYSSGTTKFGAGGDFITAPEVSSVFGHVLARQCAEVLAQVDDASILEFGAGSGKLAADLLRKLAELDALPLNYSVLEVSADLRERQESFLRNEIPELINRVSWLDKMPEAHSGVVVANEVLDALPVERFVRRAGRVMQICVATDGEAFSFVEREAPEHLAQAIAAIETDLGWTLPDGFTSEICLAAPAWTTNLASILKKGAAFLFDYGVSQREYYAEERSDGWLRCHFRHHAHDDPLIMPGIQDLTSWVNFSAVAEAAVVGGLDVMGFTTQAQFLIGGGLEQELDGFTELPIDAQLKLSGQVKLLTLPGEMGENFKCLGLSRGDITSPAAFFSADRTLSL